MAELDPEKVARIGAGSHCTVLKGDAVNDQKVNAARRFFESQTDFHHLEPMQELSALLNNLQS